MFHIYHIGMITKLSYTVDEYNYILAFNIGENDH